ncbi:hypothetical protein THAOC_13117, partial [Thalassiosira oceanica]
TRRVQGVDEVYPAWPSAFHTRQRVHWFSPCPPSASNNHPCIVGRQFVGYNVLATHDCNTITVHDRRRGEEQTNCYASSWHSEALTARHRTSELRVASRKEGEWGERTERRKEDTRGEASLGMSQLR